MTQDRTTKLGTVKTPQRLFKMALLAAASMFMFAGCSMQMMGSLSLPSQADQAQAAKACSKTVDQTFSATKIESGSQLDFDSSALALFNDSNFQVESLVLRVQFAKKPAQTTPFSLGLNGLSLSRTDGRKGFDNDDPKQPLMSVVHLETMTLGGGLLAALFIADIQKNHGALKLSIAGTGLTVKAGSLEIIGYYKNSCATPTPTPKPSPTPVSTGTPHPTPTPVIAPTATPTPTPTPAPVAPVVQIQSELPTGSPTNLSTEQFAFGADQSGATFLCSLDGAAAANCSSPMVYSNLINGAHTFKVDAVSSQGLHSAQPASYSWSVNVPVSAVSINAIPALTNQQSIAISFSSTENGTFYCSVDAGAPSVCTSPLKVNSLTEGLHQVGIFLVDTVGNHGATASAGWRVDLTPPLAQIITVTPADAYSNVTTRQITFNSNESASFACSLDSATFAACTSPVSLSGLNDGLHQFSVQATDSAGNVGLIASTSWTTDTTAPTLTLQSAQPAAGKTNAANYNVQVLASEVGTLACQVDGAPETTCTSPVMNAFNGNGLHELSVVAIDRAGNRSKPLIVDWDVNMIQPQISFAAFTPSANAAINTTSLSVTIAASSDTTLSATLNGNAVSIVQNAVSLSGLAEGSYELGVTGVDSYGNASNQLVHDFNVDTTAPVITLASSIGNGTYTNVSANLLNFSANEASTFFCQLDGAGFSACSSPLSFSALADGSHDFDVEAIDLAGNVSAVQSVTWTVDTIAPTTQAQVSQPSGLSFVFNFTSSEPGSTYLCSVDGAAEVACASPWPQTLAVGPHSVSIHAVDQAGNRDPVGVSLNVTAHPDVTTTVMSSVPSITNQTSATFTFGSNISNATYTCSLNGAAPAACSSPYNVSGLVDGAQTLIVKAVDPASGYADATGATFHWTVDTIAPTISNYSTNATSTVVTVSWSTNEAASSELNWGTGTSVANTTNESAVDGTNHIVQLTGLNSNTVYTVQMAGHDAAGNAYKGPTMQVRTRF